MEIGLWYLPVGSVAGIRVIPWRSGMNNRSLLPIALLSAGILASSLAAAEPITPTTRPEGDEFARCSTTPPTLSEMEAIASVLKARQRELGTFAVGGQIKVQNPGGSPQCLFKGANSLRPPSHRGVRLTQSEIGNIVARIDLQRLVGLLDCPVVQLCVRQVAGHRRGSSWRDHGRSTRICARSNLLLSVRGIRPSRRRLRCCQ